MTQKEKELLLQDLCARLPYGVCVHIRYKEGEPCYGRLTPRDIQWFIDSNIENIKPYLRPMSSMTEDEKKYLLKIGFDVFDDDFDNQVSVDDIAYIDKDCFNDILDFLLKHHIDFRGLIEKGLALEAHEDMYN